MTETLERERQAAGPGPSIAETKKAREQARTEIRAGLVRLGAIDDARTALELIAESALRYGPDAGPLGYRIVDETGETRVIARDGVKTPFTIGDLVGELRHKHPTLFKPVSENVDAGPAEETKAPAVAAPPQRDWL